jgi:hypothetical protein
MIAQTNCAAPHRSVTGKAASPLRLRVPETGLDREAEAAAAMGSDPEAGAVKGEAGSRQRNPASQSS